MIEGIALIKDHNQVLNRSLSNRLRRGSSTHAADDRDENYGCEEFHGPVAVDYAKAGPDVSHWLSERKEFPQEPNARWR